MFEQGPLAGEHLRSLTLSVLRNHALHFPHAPPSQEAQAQSILAGLRMVLRAFSTNPDPDIASLDDTSTEPPTEIPMKGVLDAKKTRFITVEMTECGEYPRNMRDAIAGLRGSDFARDWLGDGFVAAFAATRDAQDQAFMHMVPDTEPRRFFELG